MARPRIVVLQEGVLLYVSDGTNTVNINLHTLDCWVYFHKPCKPRDLKQVVNLINLAIDRLEQIQSR